MDGQRTKRRRNIDENFNRLIIGCTNVTDRRQLNGRAIAYSEREREFTNVNVSTHSLKTEITVGIPVLVLCPSTSSGYYHVGLRNELRLQESGLFFLVLILKFVECLKHPKHSRHAHVNTTEYEYFK